jgi:hypothetical protein
MLPRMAMIRGEANAKNTKSSMSKIQSKDKNKLQ